MAEKSAQDQIRELKDLVVAYAKQETVDPVKNIAATLGWAVGGALCLGVAVVFATIAVLRMVQTELPELLDGHGQSSFVPYLIVLVALAGGLAIVVTAMRRTPQRKDKP